MSEDIRNSDDEIRDEPRDQSGVPSNKEQVASIESEIADERERLREQLNVPERIENSLDLDEVGNLKTDERKAADKAAADAKAEADAKALADKEAADKLAADAAAQKLAADEACAKGQTNP